MYHTGFLGISKKDLWGEVDADMNVGHCNMSLAILLDKMGRCLGCFGLFLGSDEGPKSPRIHQCVSKGPLELMK